MENKVIAKEYVDKNYIHKDVIRKYREKFIKDNKTDSVFMTQSSQINTSLIEFCNLLLEDK